MSSTVRNFLRRPGREKLLALEAVCFLAAVKVQLQHRSFNVLAKRYGLVLADAEVDDRSNDAGTLLAVGWAVERMGRAVPWNSVCLDRALAAQQMLSRRGLGGTLFLGVAKNGDSNAGLKAHAWVRSGGHFVTGRAGHEAFTVVSRFGWRAASRTAKKEEACETNGVF